MLKQTYKNKAKKVIALGLLSTMCITSLGISQTNATATFSQTSVPQQSSNVANGEILTTTSFNSVVSDIGNLITDIDGLKTYIGDKYNDLKSYVDNLIANLQITSAEIVDGTIKKEDLDPNLDLGIWKKDASGNATYGSGNILVSEVGRPTNKWGLYLWGGGNMNITGPNPGSRLGLQRDVDDATVDVGNSANNNARFDVYGNATITKDLGFKGILKGWLASLNDYVTLFKGSVGNPTTGSQDIHFLPDMVKGGDKSGTNSVKFGYNSEIDNYSFYSKVGGSNKNVFTIDVKNKNTQIDNGKFSKVYRTDTAGRTFRLASRYENAGITHSNKGHILQATWGDLNGDTENSTSDGGWGFLFGSMKDPFLYMRSSSVGIKTTSPRARALDVYGQTYIGTYNDTNSHKIGVSTYGAGAGLVELGGWNVGDVWKPILTINPRNSEIISTSSNGFKVHYDSDDAKFGLRHLGSDNNPIEIRTEDVNDDGIILTSNGKDVAKFKRSLVTYNPENSFKGFQNINDIRGKNYGPDWYANKAMHFGFVEASTIGLPSGTEGWAYVQTINKWTNGSQSHKLYQIALNSDKMFMRTNTDSTHWGTWKEIGGSSSGAKNYSWFEVDRDNHSVGTTMQVIKTWRERKIQANKKLKVSIHVPFRNDSTNRGGAYIGLEVNVNGNGWKKIGDSGYDMMTYDAKGILSYNNTFEFNPYFFGIPEGTEYTVQFRTLARSYDGTTKINESHDINKYGEDYKIGAFYHNLYIEEKDWEGWTAQEGDICDSSKDGTMYYATRNSDGSAGAVYCDASQGTWIEIDSNHCAYYTSHVYEKKQYVSSRDGDYNRMASWLEGDGFHVDGKTERDGYRASGYTYVQKYGSWNRSSARGTKDIYSCLNKAP